MTELVRDSTGRVLVGETKAVNIYKHDFDMYIGRANALHKDAPFGNPFKLANSTDEERTRELDKFKRYFLARIEADADFRRQVMALKGKRLGCYCKPLACHGDIIAEWVDANVNVGVEVRNDES